MLMFSFVVLCVLHFGGILTLPLWLVFLPLIGWVAALVFLAAIALWARS